MAHLLKRFTGKRCQVYITDEQQILCTETLSILSSCNIYQYLPNIYQLPVGTSYNPRFLSSPLRCWYTTSKKVLFTLNLSGLQTKRVYWHGSIMPFLFLMGFVLLGYSLYFGQNSPLLAFSESCIHISFLASLFQCYLWDLLHLVVFPKAFKYCLTAGFIKGPLYFVLFLLNIFCMESGELSVFISIC